MEGGIFLSMPDVLSWCDQSSLCKKGENFPRDEATLELRRRAVTYHNS
jgi:hypothetical protein